MYTIINILNQVTVIHILLWASYFLDHLVVTNHNKCFTRCIDV